MITTVLTGLFIITMGGVLIFAFKKDKSIFAKDLSEEEENESGSDKIITSLSEKLLIKLNEAKDKLKGDQTHFNLPSGEPGLFL